MGVSPLQGTKIVIQNLQTSVTQVLKLNCHTAAHPPQEDILELFGDIGAMRRAKLISPGHAEVTYVNKADASRYSIVFRMFTAKYLPAVRPQGRGDLPQQAAGRQADEVSDGRGRQVRVLDMHHLHSLPSTVAPGGATLTLPKELQGGKDKRGPQPDIDSIHR